MAPCGAFSGVSPRLERAQSRMAAAAAPTAIPQARPRPAIVAISTTSTPRSRAARSTGSVIRRSASCATNTTRARPRTIALVVWFVPIARCEATLRRSTSTFPRNPTRVVYQRPRPVSTYRGRGWCPKGHYPEGCVGRAVLRRVVKPCGIGAPSLRQALDRHLKRAVPGHPGPRRNQLPDDDVLLEPEERVHLPLGRGVGQDPRRFLEAGGRQEALRRE